MATYRIAVGKRHKVEPRQIVGALANEGGLSRGDFGHIQIRPDFSLVELPADLPPGTEAALAKHPHLRQADRAAPRRRRTAAQAAPQELTRPPRGSRGRVPSQASRLGARWH